MVEILDIPVQALQFFVSVVGVLAAASIAVVGAIIAYKNTYGSKPLFLVVQHGINAKRKSYSDNLGQNATFVFEVWNNRKYPIQIIGIEADVSLFNVDEEIRDIHVDKMNIWLLNEKKITFFGENRTVNPLNKEVYKLEIPVVDKKLKDIINDEKRIEVKTRYFDPVSNKKYDIVAIHGYKIRDNEMPYYIGHS